MPLFGLRMCEFYKECALATAGLSTLDAAKLTLHDGQVLLAVVLIDELRHETRSARRASSGASYSYRQCPCWRLPTSITLGCLAVVTAGISHRILPCPTTGQHSRRV